MVTTYIEIISYGFSCSMNIKFSNLNWFVEVRWAAFSNMQSTDKEIINMEWMVSKAYKVITTKI